MLQQPGSSTKRSHPGSPDPEQHRSSGLKHSLHGVVYQFKLSMLFVYRALKNGYKFKMATELDAADKFDDIVLECEQNGKNVRRFLQAKHKQEEYKIETTKIGNKQTKMEIPIKITTKELLRETDGRFYLPKYFTSYRKIMQNKEFNSSVNEVRDMIICTNIDLDCEELLDNEGIESEEMVHGDEILNVSRGKKQAKRYKLCVRNKSHELYEKFKKSSDLYKLAQELIDCLLNDKQINLRNELFKDYQAALVGKVLDARGCKVQKDFFKNSDTKNFRETLKEVYVLENGLGTITDAKFERDMLSSNFIASKGFLDIKNRITGNEELPSDTIKDEDIEDFFDKLVLAVNQPNEVALGEIINEEIGLEFNLVHPDLVTDNFQAKILNWLKTKDGTYLTRDGTEKFFQELKSKLFQLILIGPSAIFSSKLGKYGISYRMDQGGMQEKLGAFLESPDSRVLIVEMAQPRLGSLKISQTLARMAAYQREDSFVFISSKFLLNIEQQLLNTVDERNLLIVECAKMLQHEHHSVLTKILATSKSKLILITNVIETDFIKKLERLQVEIEKIVDDSSSFVFLTIESQNKILENKVIFQGVPVKLGEIVDGDDVDANTLLQMLNGTTITIGLDVNHHQFNPDYFIPRIYSQYVEIDSEIETDVQQGRFQDTITYDETDFENLEGTVHLLQKQTDVILWKKSKGSVSPLLQYKVYKTDEWYLNFYNNSTENDLLQQNTVIIADSAGMGKSITLSYIAWKLKKTDASSWVVRIDLNDYTAKFKLFQEKIDDVNFEEIKTFLAKDVLNLDHFGTALFKARLDAKQNVVFLFDGFDEISPYYENIVMHIIKEVIIIAGGNMSSKK